MSNKNFCLFCSIQKEKEKIIYEDDYIFVIHDIQKASAIEHILVCSKEHLVSVLHLNKNHIPLILLMKQKALKVLDELNEKGKYRFFFKN